MKKIFLLLPLLALACNLSDAALIVPSPTVPPSPAPTVAPVQNVPQAARTHVCTVTADALHLRDAPTVQGLVLAWLRAGDVVTLLPDPPAENWVRVQADELTGWINSNYCERN